MVGRERISDAYARLQTAASAVAVGSPSLTGALLSAVAAPFALVTAGISYVLSALVPHEHPGQGGRQPPPGVTSDSGRRHGPACPSPMHHPVLRGLFLSGMILNAATMVGSAATAVNALTVLGINPAVFAGLGTFAALGGLAASFAAPAILSRLGIGKTRIFAGLACTPVVALTPLAAVLPWFPALWLGASAFGWAFLIVVTSVAGAGIIPRIARPIGSVQSWRATDSLSWASCRSASLAGGALAAWIGVQPVLWIWALLAGASAVPIASRRCGPGPNSRPEFDGATRPTAGPACSPVRSLGFGPCRRQRRKRGVGRS